VVQQIPEAGEKMMLFYTSSAKHIADRIRVRKGRFILRRLSDNEIYVRVEEDVKDRDVVLLAGFPSSAENFLELVFFLDALERLKARVNLVITYFGYARQDRIVKKGEALSAAVVSRIIAGYKPKTIRIIDMHSERVKEFLGFKNEIPLELFVPFFRDRKGVVVVAPDYGALAKAKMFSRMLDAPVAFLAKEREGGKVKIVGIKGHVKGKDVVIVDDIIDTGATIIKAVGFLKGEGCKDVYVAATHGIFSGDAIKRLEESAIQKIFVTDTIPQKRRSRNIKVVPISGFIGRLVKNMGDKMEMADEKYIKHCGLCKKKIRKPFFYEGRVFCSDACRDAFMRKGGS
jgi:ribose-phosphate pyrophosphokinase